MLKLIQWWFGQFTLHGGGKGGGSAAAPPPPDYRGAAIEQAAASKELATGQTWANRPTLNTPWGQMTWQAAAGVDPSTGLPITQWTGNVNLTPEQQAALDAQQRIQAGRSGAAETLLGQATGAFGQEFNWAGLPAAPGSIQAAQQGAYQTLSQMLQPGRQQQEAGLEAKLANMGLPRGSEAWNREKAKLQSDWAQQDKSMMAQALAEGRADVGAQAQLRQQAIAEEAQRRGMSLNELNALLTGQQVSMPQMPSFMGASAGQAPNLLGAAQAQGQYGLNAANQNLAAQASGPDIGSLVGTVGGIAAAAMLSDVRLKSGLRALGRGARGLTMYAYRIGGREEIGVLAQEVAMVAPHLVVVTSSGHLAVCYGGL
jgi:hypothetical protein